MILCDVTCFTCYSVGFLLKHCGYRLPPDAFSFGTRDIIKVFIVTLSHCCKEFFLRPLCWIDSSDSVLYASEQASSNSKRRYWIADCRWCLRICIVNALLVCGKHSLGTGSSPVQSVLSGRLLIIQPTVPFSVERRPGSCPLIIFGRWRFGSST